MKQDREELLKEAADILSQKFNTDIEIKSSEVLSNEGRRNFVLRIYLDNSSGTVPLTIILKQSLIEKSSNDDKLALGRFARDWAGLECLNGKTIAPEFYGGSIKSRFILLEDLGSDLMTLVDHLMSDDLLAATNALHRYMKVMAQFHGIGHKNIAHYLPMIQKIYPTVPLWQDDYEEMLAKVKTILEKLNINWTESLESEMNQVLKLVKEPNPFTSLMHGDICPDNVIDYPFAQKMKIIDFEWSYVGNALLDAIYLRMYMPTCWCVKAFPDDVIEQGEELYRKELIKYIPIAADDEVYFKHYIAACAYTIFWRLQNIEYVLDHELSQEDLERFVPPKWKAEHNIQRPRNLMRLEQFMTVAKRHDSFPHTRAMAEAVLDELRKRWQDSQPMEFYPVFNSKKQEIE